MIKIVDYGLGNVLAFINVFKALNIKCEIAKTSDELYGASHIILPGVGSFDYAVDRLNNSGMRNLLEQLVLDDKIPVLGVCVGMQLLAKKSDEGSLLGLGWLDASVRKFDISADSSRTLCLPHMGWNDVNARNSKSNLFKNIESDPRFYFLHSYYFHCNDEVDVLAESIYGTKFACAVKKDNIYGVQFHPEKSHHFGSCLLRNFAEL